MSSLTPCERFKTFFQKGKLFQLEQAKFYKNFSKLLPQINIPSDFPNMTAFENAKNIATHNLKNPQYKIPALFKIYELYLKLTTSHKSALTENMEKIEIKKRELKMVKRKIEDAYHKITNIRDAAGKSPISIIWNENYKNANNEKNYLELIIRNLKNHINALNSLKEINLFKETFDSLFKVKREVLNLENYSEKLKNLNLITIHLKNFSKTFIEENFLSLNTYENQKILKEIRSFTANIHDRILDFIELVKSEFENDEKKIATPKFLSLFETLILNFISCYAYLTNNVKMKPRSINYFFQVVDYLTVIYLLDDGIKDIEKNQTKIAKILTSLKLSTNIDFRRYTFALRTLKDDLPINVLFSLMKDITEGKISYKELILKSSENGLKILEDIMQGKIDCKNLILKILETGLKTIPYFKIQNLMREELHKIINHKFKLSHPNKR